MLKVDIILICYNQSKYIRQALDSIFLQKVDPEIQLRLIIADDASTDDTLSIIKDCCQKRIFEIYFLPQGTNVGLSKNYQRAFEAASGDYIAVLEGDDYWSSENHIQQHIDFLEQHKECSMSMNFLTKLFEATGETKTFIRKYSTIPHWVDVREQIVDGNQLGNMSACVLRTSCVKQLPQSLFDIYIADWMIGVMMAEQGPIALLGDSTSVYRVNDNGQWAGVNLQDQNIKLLELVDLYDKYQKGKYHAYWEQFKKNASIGHKKRKTLKTRIKLFFRKFSNHVTK